MTLVDRTLTCLACNLVLAVDMSGDAREAVDELLPLGEGAAPLCPQCRQKRVVVVAGRLAGASVLAAAQYLRAHYGIAVPGDLEPTEANVRAALLGQPLRRVALETTEVSGCVINALELWDGTTIHLGRGADGAVVYRISTPHSSLLKDST